MARGRILFSMLAVCILCSGCYESKYPLSSSESSRIDSRLLKGWIEQPGAGGDKPSGKPCLAVICKFSENEYLVAFGEDNNSATIARAYTTMVAGVPVLNMQGIESAKPKDRTFVFFAYSFSPDGTLQTRMISSDSPLLEKKTFSSQAAFAAYITKHIHDDRLFGPVQRFKAVEKMGLKLSP